MKTKIVFLVVVVVDFLAVGFVNCVLHEFTIRTFHGKQCVTNPRDGAGSRLVISDCSKVNINSNSGNKSKLRGQRPTTLAQAQTHAQGQAWTYYDYKAETPTSFFAQLQLKGTNKCLSLINKYVGLYTCMKGVRGQVWNLRRLQHVVQILDPLDNNENEGHGSCLAVQASSGYEQIFGNGTPLEMEECDPRKNKMFLLVGKM